MDTDKLSMLKDVLDSGVFGFEVEIRDDPDERGKYVALVTAMFRTKHEDTCILRGRPEVLCGTDIANSASFVERSPYYDQMCRDALMSLMLTCAAGSHAIMQAALTFGLAVQVDDAKNILMN